MHASSGHLQLSIDGICNHYLAVKILAKINKFYDTFDYCRCGLTVINLKLKQNYYYYYYNYYSNANRGDFEKGIKDLQFAVDFSGSHKNARTYLVRTYIAYGEKYIIINK